MTYVSIFSLYSIILINDTSRRVIIEVFSHMIQKIEILLFKLHKSLKSWALFFRNLCFLYQFYLSNRQIYISPYKFSILTHFTMNNAPIYHWVMRYHATNDTFSIFSNLCTGVPFSLVNRCDFLVRPYWHVDSALFLDTKYVPSWFSYPWTRKLVQREIVYFVSYLSSKDVLCQISYQGWYILGIFP